MTIPQAPLSAYIHMPFCETRCSYCAFNIYTDLIELAPTYVQALQREIEFAAAGNHAGQSAPGHGVALSKRRIHTVYFGGGTPSLLRARHYVDILDCLARHFTLAHDLEVSLESNPNDLSTAYLRELRAAGINRLSIGMQSASNRVLQLFERRHAPEAVASALRYARQAGFDNVNLDVIFGSPGETLAEWKRTVAAIRHYAPDHVSMYGLELKGGTALRAQVDAGALPQPEDDVFADMYEYASGSLEQAGYAQYEISNWAMPQRQCRHNLQYWRNLPYLGLGAGAQGFAGGLRYSNIAHPLRYIAALKPLADSDEPRRAGAKYLSHPSSERRDKPKQGRSGAPSVFPLSPAVAKSTRVDDQDDLYVTVMMGLRLTKEGLCRPTFQRRFGMDIVDKFPSAIKKLRRLGLILVESDRLRLSERGRLLSNSVIRELV